MRCHACHQTIAADRVRAVDCGVSSDCQPVLARFALAACSACGLVQKDTGAEWASLCEDIYSNYKIYHQAGGKEQKALGARKGAFAPRSELLVEYLRETSILGEGGAALDVGCGNGAFLRTFHRALPEWSVAGAELNSTFREAITSISGTARFLDQKDLRDLNEQFALVTLIHCLEHVPGPIEYLRGLHRLLGPQSVLLIQVPDAEANPFDLVVVDHCSHFSASSLRGLVARAGYEVVACDNRVLNKEITLLARPGTGAPAASPSADAERPGLLERNLAWLEAVSAEADRIRMLPEYCVFGSSIAATWVGMKAGDNLRCFIDEDADRIGRRLLGAPIVGLDEVPSGAIVFVPLAPRLARVIGERLRRRGLNAVEPG